MKTRDEQVKELASDLAPCPFFTKGCFIQIDKKDYGTFVRCPLHTHWIGIGIWEKRKAILDAGYGKKEEKE